MPELRQRHQATTSAASENEDSIRPRKLSLTELPVLQANGQPAMEQTEIPTPKTLLKGDSSCMDDKSDRSYGSSRLPTGNQSQTQVAKSEGKKRKIAVRVVSSVLMIGTFLGLMYMGHVYICVLVALVEMLLVSCNVVMLEGSWVYCYYLSTIVLIPLPCYS